MSAAPLSTKTVLTTVQGEVVIAKNFLHAFGMRRPLTLMVAAFIVGQAVFYIFHV